MAPHIIRGVKHIANTPKMLVIAMVTVFFGSSLAYMLAEGKGPVESMWWAIVTASTVGYGDQYPETTVGRFIGAVLIISYVWLLIFAGAQITAKLVADPDCFSDAEQEEFKADVKAVRAELETLAENMRALDANGVRHMVIINSISDLSNDELRKLLDVQKGLNSDVRSTQA